MDLQKPHEILIILPAILGVAYWTGMNCGLRRVEFEVSGRRRHPTEEKGKVK